MKLNFKKITAMMMSFSVCLSGLLGTSLMKASAAEEVKQKIYYNFEEITSVDNMEAGMSYIFLPVKYAENEAVAALPDGSAVLGYAGADLNTANFEGFDSGTGEIVASFESLNDYFDNYFASFEEFQEYMENYFGVAYDTYEEYIEIVTTMFFGTVENDEMRVNLANYCNQAEQDGYVTVIRSGQGFDGCPGGAIAFFEYDGVTAWYFGCSGGGVSYVGPFYAFEYEEAEFTAEDIEVVPKGSWEIPTTLTTITIDDVIVVVNISGKQVDIPFYDILASNNTIDPSTGDSSITVKVGNITKEVTIKSKQSPPDAAVVSKEDGKIMGLVANAKYELTVDGSTITVTADSEGGISISQYAGKTIYLAKAGDDNTITSERFEIQIPSDIKGEEEIEEEEETVEEEKIENPSTGNNMTGFIFAGTLITYLVLTGKKKHLFVD